MIWRYLIAVAVGLLMVGGSGAPRAHAQEPPKVTPAAPVDNPPKIPAETPKDVPVPGDAPPPLGDENPFTDAEKPKTAPKNIPAAKPQKPPGEALPKSPPEPISSDPKDEELIQAQGPADGSALPPAKELAGGAPANVPPAGDPSILPPDRLPLGPSTGSLTVEVQGPANANINRELKFKIFVKNSGATPVMGVIVRDPLSDGLDFVKSDPPCTQVGPILTWHLDSLAAGAERVLIVTAIPRKTGDIDHAPTVSLRMGSKSRTMVKQPKLKVEIVPSETSKILKGQPVNFSVRVTNNGTGPAKGVVLHADLTAGLKHEEGSSLVVVFKDYLGKDTLLPGESEAIDLEADAVGGGVQECKVWVESPDVEKSPEAEGLAKVTIVEPKLVLELKGPTEKSTDAIAAYTLTVTNPGTATARNVVAAAFLPSIGGQLINDYIPSEALWSSKEKKLWWKVGDLEVGAKKELKFNVQLRGPGVFKIEAAGQADRCPRDNKSTTTHVIGMPDLNCVVTARSKVLEVGEESIYEVRISNTGTQEAKAVLVTAILTPNLKIVDTTGTQEKAKSTTEKDFHDTTFPALNIPPKGSQVLTILVKATEPGPSKCSVKVVHEDSIIENSTTTKVVLPR